MRTLDTELVSKLDDRARIDLGDLGIGELLALSRRILAELRHRGVIRSGNAPAGDYAGLCRGSFAVLRRQAAPAKLNRASSAAGGAEPLASADGRTTFRVELDTLPS